MLQITIQLERMLRQAQQEPPKKRVAQNGVVVTSDVGFIQRYLEEIRHHPIAIHVCEWLCVGGGAWRRTGSEAGGRLHWCGKLFILLFFNPPNLSSAVDVEDAFNMVDLVLEDTRQPPLGF